MYGYQQTISGAWLDNNFQSPHFPTISALIAACYESEAAFMVLHGDPANWEKKEITMEEIQAIFAPPEPEVVP